MERVLASATWPWRAPGSPGGRCSTSWRRRALVSWPTPRRSPRSPAARPTSTTPSGSPNSSSTASSVPALCHPPRFVNCAISPGTASSSSRSAPAMPTASTRSSKTPASRSPRSRPACSAPRAVAISCIRPGAPRRLSARQAGPRSDPRPSASYQALRVRSVRRGKKSPSACNYFNRVGEAIRGSFFSDVSLPAVHTLKSTSSVKGRTLQAPARQLLDYMVPQAGPSQLGIDLGPRTRESKFRALKRQLDGGEPT